MPSNWRRPAIATASFAALICQLLTGPWNIACAIDPLPAEIPDVEVTAEESIRKAAEAIERIGDPKQRISTQRDALYRLWRLGRDKLVPVLDVVERDAAAWKDKNTLGSLSEGLASVDPELLHRLSEHVTDDRILDYVLSQYAGGIARLDSAKARGAIARIKDAERRATALIVFAQTAKLDLRQIKEVLKEVDEIGWPKYYSSRDYVISSLFAKLADDEFLSAVEFIISSLPPDEAVRAFCYLAAHLRHEGKRPVLADRALEAAVDILPKCANRAAATGNLLEYGFARLDRERAAELVDEHIVPSIRVHPKHNWVALGLASGGIDFALMHAHKVADKSGIPYDYFVNGEIGLAAARIEPDEVLAWLKKQPASSARGVAAGYIAEGLANRLANQYVDPANHQLWIDSLAKEVLTISDPRQRREACEQVLRATHAPKSKARIILPLEIRQEYGRLWDNPKAAPERPRETWQVVAHARLLPTDMQLREIEKLFVARNTSAAAKILDDSSLAGDLRSEWYDKVLDRARAIPDKSRRAALLVGVAKCLRDENPGRAIDILWEAMALIRPFAHYQPGISPHDVVDYLGSVTPPRNPDEALGPSFVDFRDGGAKAATALWAFAHNLDEVDEREPVLEALAKVLVNHDQTAQAAGLTTLLSSPHRQARIWIEIAARKLGVRDDNRP